jgi:hypothetical protein
MPGSGDSLLLRMGIDLTPVQQAVNSVKSLLGELNTLSDNLSSKADSTTSALSQHMAELADHSKAVTQAAMEGATQDQKKLEISHDQTGEYSKHIGLVGDILSALKETLGIHEHVSGELEHQLTQQKRITEEVKEQSKFAEIAKGIGGVGAGAVKGLVGSGIGASVAGGILAGGGIIGVLEELKEGAEKAAEAFKELVVDSGRLVGLEDVFKRLAAGAGIDANEAFEKLQERTEGLVDKITLLRVANAGLKKDIPVERVADLSHAIVTLVESGTTRIHDVSQGMELLARALETGRGRALGAALGMDQFLSRLHDLPAALSPLEKEQLLLKNLEDEILRRSKQIGETPDTIESSLKRITIAREDLVKSFGAGFQAAPGFQIFLGQLKSSAAGLTELQGKAEAFGERVGNIFGNLTGVIESFGGVMRVAGEAFGQAAEIIERLFGVPVEEAPDAVAAIGSYAKAFVYLGTAAQLVFQTVVSALKLIQGAMLDAQSINMTIVAGLQLMTGNTTAAKDAYTSAVGNIRDATKLTSEALGTDWKKIAEDQAVSFAKIEGNLNAAADAAERAKHHQRPIKGEGPPNVPDLQREAREAQDQMKAAQAAAQERLAERQKEIDEEKKLDDLAFKYNEEDATKHYATQLKLVQESGQARLEALSNSSNAELQLAETKHQLGMSTEKEYTETVRKIYSDFQKNFVNDQKTTNLQIIALYDQQAKDIEAAIRKGIDANVALYEKQSNARIHAAQRDLQTQEEAVKAEQALNEKKFGRGEISPDAYFNQQISDINRLAQIQIDAAQKVAAEKTAQGQAEIAAAKAVADNESASQQDLENARDKEAAAQQKIADAREQLEDDIVAKSSKAEEALTALMEDQANKRMQAIQKAYQPQQQALESQLAIEQQLQEIGNKQLIGVPEDLTKQMLANLESQMSMLSQLSQRVQPYSDEWFTVLDRMEKVYQTQVKYRSELENMTALMPNIASFFDGLAKSLTEILPSKFAQNLLSTVQKGAAAMLQSFQFFGHTGVDKDPVLSKLEDQAKMMFDNMGASGKSFAAGMDQTTAVLQKSSTQWDQISQAAQKSLADMTAAVRGPVQPFTAITPVVSQLQNKLIELMHSIDDLITSMRKGAAPTGFVGPVQQSQGGMPGTAGSAAADPATQTIKQILTNMYAVTSGQSASQVAGMLSVFSAISAQPSLGTNFNDILSNIANQGQMPSTTPMAQSPYALNQRTPKVPNDQLSSNQGSIGDAFGSLMAPWAGVFHGIFGGGPQVGGVPEGTPYPSLGLPSDQEPSSGAPAPSTSSGAASLGDSLKQVGNQLKTVVSGISAIVSGKSAASGAIGGAEGGASIGGMFGPIGAGIGAIGGAITGALLGNKQAQITNELNNFTTNFKQIMNEFALNTNNLNQTIIQLQVLQGALTASMNAQKKGKDRSSFQSQISQLDQQIQQLQQQQNQVLVNMNEQLAILSAPTGMQQYLTSLQQILQQYDQFAGAAQNANELAQANQFLVESLQQYSITVSEQYNQANQSAINDAISLNSLYQQRIDLINQVNTQIESVLSAGVLTRTPTRAQTAGQEIEQIQYQANIQLQALNEQIQAEQYRVNAETQIFNMSTTTVGLEAQLLVLQNQQTNLDMQRITSLQAVVSMLQSGNFSLLGPLLAAMPGFLNPVTGSATPPPSWAAPFNGPLTPAQLGALFAQISQMPGFSQILASSTAQPGTEAIAAQFAAAYNSRAAAGMGVYRGQNLS